MAWVHPIQWFNLHFSGSANPVLDASTPIVHVRTAEMAGIFSDWFLAFGHGLHSVSGWWLTYPSEKYESQLG